jgi:hypothetical protein
MRLVLPLIAVLALVTKNARSEDVEWTEKCYPECEGKLSSECGDIILADEFGEELHIQTISPYEPVTMDYRLDRVRITQDTETKQVLGTPCRG